MIKNILIGIGLAAVVPSVLASSEINFGISSEYVFRGVPQSGGAQAWGSIDVSWDDLGLYSGLWVSNAGRAGNEEVDAYAGYAVNIAKQASLDLGGIGYFDPSAPESATPNNVGEVYLGLNWSRFNTYMYYGFGSTLFKEDEYGYFEANYEFDVLADAYVRLHGAYFAGLGDFYDQFADDSYFDYGLSFVKVYPLAGQITLAITATSIEATHGFNAISPRYESSRPQFTVGWSRRFGAAF